MNKYLGAVILLIFCASLATQVLLNDFTITQSLLDATGSADSGKDTKQLFGFFFFKESMPSVFNDKESSHLRDVKLLIWVNTLILLISAGALYQTLHKNLYQVVKYSLGFFALLGVSTFFVPFEKLFLYFHLLVFPQGNWAFSVNSTIIQYYPQELFMYYGLLIAAYTLFALLFLFFFSQSFNKL